MLEFCTPLFLMGCPRSGTTFLANLLNADRRILMTNETASFMLLDDLIKKSFKGIESGIMFGKEHNVHMSEMLDENYASLLILYYERIALAEQRCSLSYWGEKHPHIFECLSRIEKQLPASRYIYLIRDPRDCACSIAAMNRVDFSEALGVWIEIATIYQKFIASRLGEGIHTLRYEDMVANPEHEITRLYRFLTLDVPSEVRDFLDERRNIDAHNLEVRKDFAKNSVARWRNELSLEQQDEARIRTDFFLNLYGYPCI